MLAGEQWHRKINLMQRCGKAMAVDILTSTDWQAKDASHGL